MKFQNKKFFGQNFLNNRNILQSLVDAANISPDDIVLEIGPGMGTLTELLAKNAKKVIAVEKDHDLIAILQDKFSNRKNVTVVNGDILNTDIDKLGLKRGYKIVANIPYYITGKLLRVFLGENNLAVGLPKTMVLMVQKEVGDRIVAKDGKESLLSLSVKAFGAPKIIRKVPRGAFQPAPNVDSAVISIDDISNQWFKKNKIKSEVFFEILRSAFQQKRKTLRNSLSNLSKTHLAVKPPSDRLLEKFAKKRPEELSLEDWRELLH